MRSIVHLDADAFFAAVEQAADPKLRGKAVAVGGEKRGIIASASYEARKFGVYTPMPTSRARKLCPRLIVIPGDFERYEQFSQWMFGYCYDFTPDVEQTSIDEGYFDLSGVRKPAADIALKIRQAIAQRLKISVSEGLGTNKLVSAVASKLTKPAAFYEVPAGQEAEYLRPLPNKWLPGVGPKTSARLNAAGLLNIGQVGAVPLTMLELLLGSQAPLLRQFANGLDERPLVPAREPQKSFSQQETFAADLTDEEYALAVLQRMADHLFAAVRAESRSIRTLTLRVRYNDMDEDQVSESLPEPTDLETDVYGLLHNLLRRAWKRRVSLRLVSLKLSNLYDTRLVSELPWPRRAAADLRRRSEERHSLMALRPSEYELSKVKPELLQLRDHAAAARLAAQVDALRQTYGHSIVLRGHDFRLRCPPGELGGSLSRPGAAKYALKTGSRQSRQARTPALRGSVSQAPALKPCVGGPVGCPGILPKISSTRSYIPLRAHSYYSFLDSTLSPVAVVRLAWEHDLPAIALTDTGNLHGAVEFALAAKEAGVKPIIGVELRLENQPLLLYVASARGYHNLCRLLSRPAAKGAAAQDFLAERGTRGPDVRSERPSQIRPPPLTNGGCAIRASLPNEPLSVAAQQRRPFVREDLEGFTEGLIAVGNADSLPKLFPGCCYRLATAQGAPDDLPVVVCPSAHYATPAERQKFDIVQSIRTLTLLRQEHPEKDCGSRRHFRAPSELAAHCREHPEWLEHTLELAERCEFELPFGKPQFPAYAPRDGSAPAHFLRRLALEGLRRRYGARAERHRAQVEEELAIITEVGYAEYFLITWDFLQECRQRGLEWITRGSAADSLVCYCLEISGVCPIRFELYFRRFLNRERMALNKLPDIDIDFAHDAKDEVVDLIFEKYGPEQCGVVGGFSTFQARSAFAEVAKVLGVSERDARKFTDHFPWSFGGGWVPDERAPSGGRRLIEMLRASPENRDLPLDEEPYKTALEAAEFLDGFPRYPKMHPCGVVLSRQPLRELTPTFIAHKGYPTTHYDMDAVEVLGLVKMDILAQGGLAVMRDVKKMLAQRGVQVDLERCEVIAVPSSPAPEGEPEKSPRLQHGIPERKGPRPEGPAEPHDKEPDPWRDPAVWDLIAGGYARAVHHIESPAMTSLSRMCNVREIDGLIAIVSVIRPGAANEGKKLAFTRRYQGLEPVSYPHPSLEPCLRSTFGLVVYEEHILQLCEAFAGLPPGRADVLRRALNKQKRVVIEEIRGEFFAAARARGHAPEKVHEVWELATGFAGYAFCKAHSTAYGVEAYQAAWLKRYFPAEFMAAVLTNGKGFYDPLVYVLECHRLGLKLLPPSVNEPGPAFAPHGQALRVPLTRVKGLTERTAAKIIEARRQGPFASLADFFHRVIPGPEEFADLIRAGGFDEFGEPRTRQFWQAQYLLRVFADAGEPGQGWLLAPEDPKRLLPEAPLTEPTRRQRLEAETELFGFAVSGHPLELHADVAWDTYCPVNRLHEFAGQIVTVCGLVVEQRIHHQITGEPMKFLSIADWTGIIETELFAQTYKSYGLATIRYPVLELEARVEPFENGRGVSLRVLSAHCPRLRPAPR